MKIFILDDDDNIVQALYRMIERSGIPLEKTGLTSSPSDAIRIVEEERPDIILTDIRMPGMTGLEFIEEMKRCGIRSKVLFMSGYKDFEYAKEAIRLGAQDYLVKPIKEQRLVEVLHATLELINEDNRYKYERETMLKKTMYHSLTSGFQWSSSSIVQIDTIRVNAALIYWVLAIEIMNETDASSDRIAHLEAGLRRWEKQTSAFKDRVLLLHDDARRPVLVFSDYEPGTDAVRLRLWAAIKAELESALGAEMNIGVGDAATSVAALPRAFQEAKQSAERMFYADAPGVYAFYPYAAAATNLVDPFEEAKVVEAVKLGKHGEAADLIVNAFERIKRSGGDKTALLAACNRLLGQLDPAERATETFETVSRLRDWMLERLASVSIALNKARKSPDDQLIDKIVAYCANRMGEDITLQQVAEFAGYNKAYFSSFFKKKVGESFWDYLTGVRMAKAKELLETTTLAAHEIGKLVGYHNPSHFGKMFKQAVGRTPAEYKNNMTGIVR